MLFGAAGTGVGQKEHMDAPHSDKEEIPDIQLEDVSDLRSKGGDEEAPF